MRLRLSGEGSFSWPEDPVCGAGSLAREFNPSRAADRLLALGPHWNFSLSFYTRLFGFPFLERYFAIFGQELIVAFIALTGGARFPQVITELGLPPPVLTQSSESRCLPSCGLQPPTHKFLGHSAPFLLLPASAPSLCSAPSSTSPVQLTVQLSGLVGARGQRDTRNHTPRQGPKDVRSEPGPSRNTPSAVCVSLILVLFIINKLR